MRCPSCGRMLASNYNFAHGKEYKRYRCVRHGANICDYNTSVSEETLEQYLLDNLEDLLKSEIEKADAEQAKPKPKPKTDVNALKERLRRLTVSYMAGNIPDDEYLHDQAEIKGLIAKAEKEELPEVKDVTPLKKILESDVISIYQTFTDEEKRRFWRSIIEEIKIEGRKVKEIIFL